MVAAAGAGAGDGKLDRSGVIKAFLEGRAARVTGQNMAVRSRGTRYETDGGSFRVWGNEVAYWRGYKLQICDAGYQSQLTKDVINELLSAAAVPCNLYQEKHKWYVACRPGWKKVAWPSNGCITVKPRNLPEIQRAQAQVEAKLSAERERERQRAIREQRRVAREAERTRREQAQKTLFGRAR